MVALYARACVCMHVCICAYVGVDVIDEGCALPKGSSGNDKIR